MVQNETGNLPARYGLGERAREDKKDWAMLRKSKVLAAAATLLMATVAPAAAQGTGSWYAQGGYDENAPYPDPYYDDGYYEDAYEDPYYGQGYEQYGSAYGEGGYGYDTDAAQRDQAAQEWRDRYNGGYGTYNQPAYQQPAYGQPAYSQPPYQQPAYGQSNYGQPNYQQRQ